MIRKLMVPVRGDGKGDNVFAHAATLAKRFGAHVEVVHCHLKPEDLMPFGVVIPTFMRQQIEEVTAQNVDVEEQKLRNEFIKLARDLDLPVQAASAGVPSASFVEFSGKQVDAVKFLGRLSDMVCVPRPDKSRNLGANTLKSAIYSSGRPVLMCPPAEHGPGQFGRHVAIGWNGSLQATRAVAQAMPMIETAEVVTILTSGQVDHAATAAELVGYLKLHDIAADVHLFQRDGNVGRNLLQHCGNLGADLLVMGAYHESYERETMFGGNSQAVVDEAVIPVILVH